MRRLLVVASKPILNARTMTELERRGYLLATATSAAAAELLMEPGRRQAVLCDLTLAAPELRTLARTAAGRRPAIPLIGVVPPRLAQTKALALEIGAYGLLPLPLQLEELIPLAEEAFSAISHGLPRSKRLSSEVLSALTPGHPLVIRLGNANYPEIHGSSFLGQIHGELLALAPQQRGRPELPPPGTPVQVGFKWESGWHQFHTKVTGIGLRQGKTVLSLARPKDLLVVRRRGSARVSLCLGARMEVLVSGRGAYEISGWTEDISRRGLRLACQEPVYPESQVAVRLIAPAGESPRIMGRAVWLRREDPLSTIGIALRRDIGEASALLRWLRDGLAAGAEDGWSSQPGQAITVGQA